MGYRTWDIEVDGNRHTIGVDHGFWSGKRIITLDGNVLEKSWKLVDTGSEHRFNVDGHLCILKIRNSPFHYDYELFLDGKLV